MHQVIREDASRPDGAIAVWAKSDADAAQCYKRAIKRRFEFSTWLFQELGFAPPDAEIRGRMMVMTLMGETTNDLKLQENWPSVIDRHWRVLVDK
ncbi:hypothetical protein [Ruegeria atlantica]|nr:hypothetical protein [Ruegeria atlantica]